MESAAESGKTAANEADSCQTGELSGRPHDLPASPAAVAIFRAFDAASRVDNTQGNGTQPTNSQSKLCTSSSTFIQKQIQTLGWRNRHSQADFYPISVNGVSFDVKQVQRGELENTYGTGATVWPASVVMVKYLERHARRLIQNKNIVDLGSGTGITSIAAAFLGACQVICTDGEPLVVQLARDNIDRVARDKANSPTSTTKDNVAAINGCPVYTQEYWWGAGSIEDHESNSGGIDIVIVSDCVLPKLYPIAPLVEALDQLLSKSEAVGILSYEHRYYPEYDPREKFKDLAIQKNLDVRIIPKELHDPVYSTDDIEIWHVQRSGI